MKTKLYLAIVPCWRSRWVMANPPGPLIEGFRNTSGFRVGRHGAALRRKAYMSHDMRPCSKPSSPDPRHRLLRKRSTRKAPRRPRNAGCIDAAPGIGLRDVLEDGWTMPNRG